MNNSRASIEEIISEVKPALDALRFFTATTRGFRDKEQEKLSSFLRERCKLDAYTSDEIKNWLKTKAGYVDTFDYRRGDVSSYLALLKKIPTNLLVRTRDYALLIAGGSGRNPIGDKLRIRIESEFSEHPIVVPPPLDDESELSVQISLDGVGRPHN